MKNHQRLLLTSNIKQPKTSTVYNPFLYEDKKNILNMYKCKNCRKWCQVIYVDAGENLYALKAVSSCCRAEIIHERYEKK